MVAADNFSIEIFLAVVAYFYGFFFAVVVELLMMFVRISKEYSFELKCIEFILTIINAK